MSERVDDLELVRKPVGAGASAECARDVSPRWNPFGFDEAQRDDHDAQPNSIVQVCRCRIAPPARRADTEYRRRRAPHAGRVSWSRRHLPCAVHARRRCGLGRAAEGRGPRGDRAHGAGGGPVGGRTWRPRGQAQICRAGGASPRGGRARLALAAFAATFHASPAGRVVPHLGGAGGDAAGAYRFTHSPVVAWRGAGAGRRLLGARRGPVGFRHFDGGSQP